MPSRTICRNVHQKRYYSLLPSIGESLNCLRSSLNGQNTNYFVVDILQEISAISWRKEKLTAHCGGCCRKMVMYRVFAPQLLWTCHRAWYQFAREDGGRQVLRFYSWFVIPLAYKYILFASSHSVNVTDS